jgi:hypothetical protein
MPTHLRIFTALAAGAFACGLAGPDAQAQNGFNPFWQDQFTAPKKPNPKPPAPAAETPDGPYLPPMSEQPTWGSNTPSRAAPPRGYDAGTGNTADTRPQQQRPVYNQRGPIIGGQGAEPRWQKPLPQTPPDENSLGVDSTDLAPVMAGDGTNLPYELWRGLTTKEIGELISSLRIPPRSPAVHQLWQRLITSNVPAPGSDKNSTNFASLRAEALYRSGLLPESDDVLKSVADTSTPLIAMLKGRTAIAVGRMDEGCSLAKGLVRDMGKIPKVLAGDAALTIGYCATRDNNAAAAGLSAELAAENGVSSSPGLAALKAFSVGGTPRLGKGKSYGIVDYLILQQSGVAIGSEQLTAATPALLAFIANQPNAQMGDLRLAAAEAALGVNAIATDTLAALYRADAQSGSGPAGQRAKLFMQAETETMPMRKARHIRAFLDDARRSGFYWHALELMAPASNAMALVPEIGWFAETGIETSLAAGDIANARKWAAFAGSQYRSGAANLDHWVALIELIDPNQGSGRLQQGLQTLEQMAIRGRLDPVLLHRLATVLDALNVQVPIPLWEAASRTPQPTTGHLPETGVLSRLQSAAKKKEFGRTVLLTMKTIGPDGAEGAHMIALGDSIRALRRAGLDGDARMLGLEALFGAWPRSVTN